MSGNRIPRSAEMEKEMMCRKSFYTEEIFPLDKLLDNGQYQVRGTKKESSHSERKEVKAMTGRRMIVGAAMMVGAFLALPPVVEAESVLLRARDIPGDIYVL